MVHPGGKLKPGRRVHVAPGFDVTVEETTERRTRLVRLDVAGPVHEDEPIVVAEIDLDRIAEEQQAFDAAGHYHRPDVFQLTVDERPRAAVEWVGPVVAAAEPPAVTDGRD